MIKDIIQNIKITAQTDKATAKLNQMKATMNTIPKQIQIKTQNYNKVIDSMKNSMLSLAAIATAAISVIRKGFLGLAEQQQSIKRLNTAIQITGTQATLSSTALFNYFQTLQSGIGQSADELATIASKFVSAGIASQSMVRQYTNATIGLAQQTGKSIDEVSDKLIRAIQGQTKGLKQFGIATNTGATAQQLLNEALRRGSIAFNNIDTNSATRSMMIFRQSFNNMLQGFAQKFLPAISSMINFIAKNLNVIGNILLGAAIFSAMKSIYNIAKAIYAVTLGQGAALVRQIKTKLQLSAIDIERLQLLAAQGLITSNQQKALERQLITQELYNKKLNGTISLSSTLSSIFSKSNIILAATTIALTLILSNWTKIKQKITGVTEQTRRHNEAIADATNEYINYKSKLDSTVYSLQQLYGKQKLSNIEIDKKKSLINDLNSQFGSMLTSAIDYNDTLQTMRSKLSNVNTQLQDQKRLLIDTSIYEANKQSIQQLVSKLTKLQKKRSDIFSAAALRRQLQNPQTKKSIIELNQQILNSQNELNKSLQYQNELYAKIYKTLLGQQLLPGVKSQTASLIDLIKARLQYQRIIGNQAGIYRQINNLQNEYKKSIDAVTGSTIQDNIKKLQLAGTIAKLRKQQQLLNSEVGPKQLEYKLQPSQVTDPLNGSALQNIQLSPIQQWMSQFATKAWQTSTMLQMAWVNVFDSIAVAWDGLASKIGSGFAAVIMQGQSFSKAMKNIFKDFASAIIAQISKIIVKLIVALTLKTLLGGFIGGIFGGGSSTATLSGNLLDTYNLASIGKSGKTSSSNSIISISTSNLLYSGKNNLINKLDEVITAVSNIQPVQTQIIDLPTLATANKIGNAMILQGV